LCHLAGNYLKAIILAYMPKNALFLLKYSKNSPMPGPQIPCLQWLGTLLPDLQ